MPQRVIPIQAGLPHDALIAVLNKNFAELDAPQYLSGTHTFEAISVAGSSTERQSIEVKHGLRWPPSVTVFTLRPTHSQSADELAIFPGDIYRQVVSLQEVGEGLLFGSALVSTIYFGSDDTNVYIGRSLINSTGGSLDSDALTIRYYITREQAS